MYEKLKNFQHIFQREDYKYISDENHIEQVSTVFLTSISNPDGNEKKYHEFLTTFLQHLISFYQWINCKDVLVLNEGYSAIQAELVRAMNLFQEPEAKRKAISKRYLRKFKENFLNGYTVFLVGVRTLFDPEHASTTGLNKEQMIQYIFDNKEGLSKKFIFNAQGKHAFANRVVLLNRQELLVVLRLLVRPTRNQIRTSRLGWLDLGVGISPVKILGMAPKMFGRQRIYYLFKISEHRDYEAHLNISPHKCAFQAA